MRFIFAKPSVSNLVFSTFWQGKKLCPVSVMCMNSFRHHHHSINLYAYDQIDFTPPWVSLRPAQEIVPASKVFMAHGGFEHFSDMFRYQLLYKRGGWWIDTDVVCNSTVVPATSIAFAKESRTGSFNIGQMKFPKNSSVMRKALESAATSNVAEWGSTGPILFNQIILDTGMEKACWNTKDFYPICWVESAKFLLPEYREEIQERTRDAMFIHIYTSRFRRRLGFDHNLFLPPQGSFLEFLYLKYGVGESVADLKPVDTVVLRRRIASFMKENWIQEMLEKENISFRMQEMNS